MSRSAPAFTARPFANNSRTRTSSATSTSSSAPSSSFKGGHVIRSIAVLTMAAALFAATPARAQIQTKGPEVFTGKLQIGFHPIGFQTGFNGNSPSGYKLTADIAGLIAQPGKLSLWLGGGINYAA